MNHSSGYTVHKTGNDRSTECFKINGIFTFLLFILRTLVHVFAYIPHSDVFCMTVLTPTLALTLSLNHLANKLL